MSGEDFDYEALIGRVLGGRMVIQRYLGGGGMGWVYAAFHQVLGKMVAVKILRTPGKAKMVDRFIREAQTASSLDHPNFVSILDISREQDDQLLYIVMEYLEGEPLSDVIAREAPMAGDRVCRVTMQILAALAAAHDNNIVHRDLKPQNVMVVRRRSDDGEEIDFIKVCDFGLAKSMEPKQPALARDVLTMEGSIVGTPAYIAPEQAMGGVIDGRADLYSCGVLMYQMLSGHLPFDDIDPGSLVLKHIHEKPLPLSKLVPDIDEDLEFIVLWALEKRPKDRCPSAREFRDALKTLLDARDMFELSTMVHVNELRRSLFAEPMEPMESGEAMGLASSDRSEVPTAIGPPPPEPPNDTNLDGFSRTKDYRVTPETPVPSPPAVPLIPAPAPLQALPRPSSSVPETSLTEELWSLKGLARYLKERFGIEYQGAPSTHAFWLRDLGEVLGPLNYHQMMDIFVRVSISEGVPWISADAHAWLDGGSFVKLTGQEALLDAGPPALAGPSFEEQSATRLLGRLARERFTGKAIFLNSEKPLHMRVELIDGRITSIYSNELALQLPALLKGKGILKDEALPALMHSALRLERSLEALLGRVVDVGRIRRAVLRERLIRLFRWRQGRAIVDDQHRPALAEAPAGPTLSFLPNVVGNGMSVQSLERAILPFAQQRMRALAGAPETWEFADSALLVVKDILAAERLGEALGGAGRAHFKMAVAYVLLEAGLVGPV